MKEFSAKGFEINGELKNIIFKANYLNGRGKVLSHYYSFIIGF